LEELNMAVLCEMRKDGTLGEQWEIRDRPFLVGRGQSVQLRVKDESVSRLHFRILRHGQDYLLEDLNSRNGTWVGGCRTNSTKLSEEEYILAGQTLFLFAERTLEPGHVKSTTGPHGTVMLRREFAHA
jgi:pSer/pThr/pTyr-binding forkhead associated (FHA) protein